MAQILGTLVAHDSHQARLVARLVARGHAELVVRDRPQLEHIAVQERLDLAASDPAANTSIPAGICRRLKLCPALPPRRRSPRQSKARPRALEPAGSAQER